jgi:hypothetical protein
MQLLCTALSSLDRSLRKIRDNYELLCAARVFLRPESAQN